MSDEPEFAPSGGEGGPHKTFWGHVQDLRTALVRSAVAIGVALLACFLLANHIGAILEYPLRRMTMFEKLKPTVTLEIGSTTLGPFEVSRDDFPILPEGAAPGSTYRVGTARIGDQQVLTLKPDPAAPNKDPLQVRLHNFSPTEPFSVAFHLALYGAFAVSSPFWIYFLGSFILPALNLKERRMMGPWLAWSITLFLTGALTTYFFLLPVALRASMEYSSLLGFSATDWRADEYISFVSKFVLGMGVGFQFPLVVLGLVKLGFLTHKQLATYRRHVIVLSLILGALLTTPEVLTQIAMAVPLYLLYEICIWIAWYWERKKRRGEAAAP
jgi:sec-independent protein translocase protein TatC